MVSGTFSHSIQPGCSRISASIEARHRSWHDAPRRDFLLKKNAVWNFDRI
jgi:hypothetical protein